MWKKRKVRDFMNIWEYKNCFNFGNWGHLTTRQKLEKKLLQKINMKIHWSNVFLDYYNRILFKIGGIKMRVKMKMKMSF